MSGCCVCSIDSVEFIVESFEEIVEETFKEIRQLKPLADPREVLGTGYFGQICFIQFSGKKYPKGSVKLTLHPCLGNPGSVTEIHTLSCTMPCG